MNNDDFKIQILRLIDCYGPRFYPEERVKAIYEEFKTIDIVVFKKAIAYLIAENLYAPVLNKIREAVNQFEGSYRAEKREKLEIELGDFKCPLCKNSGAIIAFKDDNSYCFRCSCKIGYVSQNNWPIWREDLNEIYQKVEMPRPGRGPRTKWRHGLNK